MGNGGTVMRVAAFLVFLAGLMLGTAESDLAVEPLNFVGIAIMALGAALMILIDRQGGGQWEDDFRNNL
jgi:hypothetical protein